MTSLKKISRIIILLGLEKMYLIGELLRTPIYLFFFSTEPTSISKLIS